ncbi:MAG TPA: ABC transporter substrate-binding protein [Oceanobacillus sp.]|nr:ABC transporter substrate-binding protein [Oceanobacillus sp.]
MKTIFTLLIFGLLASAVLAQEAPTTNLTDACVEIYDESVDYFPDKTEVEYAAGFEVEYFNNYKVINVLQPWRDADVTFTYVLVQCGTPAPEGYEDAAIIEVPIDTVVSMSTTYVPHFVELGLLDHVVGVDEFDFIYNADMRELIETGEIVEVGGSSAVNVELVLDLDPDLIMTFGLGSPDYDAHPVLLDAGLNVALNSDYMETSPLGRAEWIKFTAMFFNREADANAFFDGVAERYNELVAQVGEIEERPTVLVNGNYGDTWFVAGGASYTAQLIKDAGGDYLWADDDSTGGLPLSFEAVLERGQDADYWINPNFWFSLADGLAEDERYAEFEAFQNGNVYNNNARVNEFGGNDYLEGGVVNPDVLLADLVAIFHPELLPDHELFYYQQLQ